MDASATTAARLVEDLLDSADDAKEYALALNLDLSGVSPEQVKVFKRQATGYIKWISGEAWNPAIADDIRHAATFGEVAEILSRYDEPELSFLSMIAQGYF